MKSHGSSLECRTAIAAQRMFEPKAGGSRIYISAQRGLAEQAHRKLGTDPSDIVRPKDSPELRKVRFLEVRSAGDRLHVNAANLHLKLVGSGIDDDVRPVGSKLLVDAIADGGRQCEHGGYGRSAQKNRESGQRLASSLTAEALH
jgi:hypothetical protein